ncbi:MAG: IS110 family transposase [Thainema sp.]
MTVICGLDVGKTSVSMCLLDEVPNDLKRFAQRHKTESIQIDRSGIDYLLSLDADCYALEPTGRYSRPWIDQLRGANKIVRLIPTHRIGKYRGYKGLNNKSDRYDPVCIAAYTLENFSDESAFIDLYAEDLREMLLSRHSLSRLCTSTTNRLWAQLATEWPEVCRTASGRKPQNPRWYLYPDPPNLWRFIAGEDVRGQKVRSQKLSESIGTGLSDATTWLASQVCDLHRQMYRQELVIDEMLNADRFRLYQEVFDDFGFSPKIRAVLLSRIFPFEKFLGSDGKPIVEYVYSDSSRRKNKKTKRRRSEAAFKLSLGMGMVQSQSGNKSEWTAGGASYARTALWQHVKVLVVVQSSRLTDQKYLAAHRAYYRQLDKKLPGNKRVMMTASRVSRDLFKALSIQFC